MTIHMKFILALFISLLTLTACASDPSMPTTTVQTDQNVTTAPAAEKLAHADYIIQPGDVLDISVWKEKDLQRGEVLVRPDGGMSFPLVGDMVASGLTLEQLRAEMTTKLSKYVPDPVITIAVKQSSGNKVYVVGKVNRPGEFIATRNMDVMQVLSMAGGPTAYASVNKIKILRRENGVLKSIPFKYSRVESGKDLDQNIILQGGDVVVVP